VAVACAVSLVLCVWDIFLAVSGEEIEDMPYFRAVLVAFNLIPAVFTAAAYQGRHWGRIGLLVVTALGVLALPLVILLEGEWMQAIDVETVLYSAAGVVVIVLLMLPTSGAWYRTARVPAESSNKSFNGDAAKATRR
jgi:hypothetical protein